MDTTIIRSTGNILKMLQHLELLFIMMYNLKFMLMTMNAMLNI